MNTLLRKRDLLNLVRILIILSFSLLCVWGASAQESIFVGGTSIKLGDDKTTITGKISKYYKLLGSEGDVTTILNKQGEGLIGYVQFRNEKVIGVGKNWANENQKHGREIIKALIGAISTLPEDKRFALVHLDRTFAPDISFETIKLIFGKREIVISLIERKDGVNIQVDEYLR